MGNQAVMSRLGYPAVDTLRFFQVRSPEELPKNPGGYAVAVITDNIIGNPRVGIGLMAQWHDYTIFTSSIGNYFESTFERLSGYIDRILQHESPTGSRYVDFYVYNTSAKAWWKGCRYLLFAGREAVPLCSARMSGGLITRSLVNDYPRYVLDYTGTSNLSASLYGADTIDVTLYKKLICVATITRANASQGLYLGIELPTATNLQTANFTNFAKNVPVTRTAAVATDQEITLDISGYSGQYRIGLMAVSTTAQVISLYME